MRRLWALALALLLLTACAAPEEEPEAEEEEEEKTVVQEAAVSAFAPAGGIPAEPEGVVEDPFAGDAFEDDSDTRVLNLDDLQFGPNYTKD